MTSLVGMTAVVTGGTDGIGAATAAALVARGADVIAIGRSAAKAAALQAQADSMTAGGSLRVLARDFSSMATVRSTVRELAESGRGIDLLVHAVGILITSPAYSAEGIELDLAVSYLSRFAFLEDAHRLELLHDRTRMVNIAASAPRVPRMARMEFSSLADVAARTGMRSHGQAQLANDLLTVQAPALYGVTSIGYGPGAVDTSIRRELPRIARAVMKPFYARTTRRPADAADDIVAALGDPALPPRSATFRNRRGPFPVSEFVADPVRQAELLAVSRSLLATAYAASVRGSRGDA